MTFGFAGSNVRSYDCDRTVPLARIALVPGIFGAATATDRRIDDLPLDRVAARLRHQPGLEVSVARAAGGSAALGAVDLGLLPGSGQVHRAPDGSLAVVHGTISNGPQDGSVAAAVLARYTTDPVSLTCWRGIYALAIWDAPRRTLLLTNGRFGLRNVYYTIIDGVLCFAPLVGALLELPAVSRALDMEAVADFLAFEHVTGDRTLLREVRALPPATVATFDARGLRLERYWQPSYRPNGTAAIEEYVEEFGRRLDIAIAQVLAAPLRPGFPISGGLDSRAILSVLGPGHLEAPCFTYGIPGCDDLAIATELARVLGAPHHVFALEPGYIAARAAEQVRLTDGMQLALNVHATVLQRCAEWCDTIVLGNGGDCLLDGLWTGRDVAPDSEEFARGMFERLNRVIDRPLAAAVLGPALRDVFAGGYARLRERLARYPGATAADRADAYNVGERHWRWVLQGIPAQSTHVEFVEPFYDYDLADFALTVPASLRTRRRLHIELIRRRAPALAALPRQGTAQPLAESWAPPGRAAYLRARSRAALDRLRRALGRATTPMEQRLSGFADYGFELRGPSRGLLDEVVLGVSTLDRGWYKPEGLRRLVADHLARRHDHTLALGAIITLELWLREFVDGR